MNIPSFTVIFLLVFSISCNNSDTSKTINSETLANNITEEKTENNKNNTSDGKKKSDKRKISTDQTEKTTENSSVNKKNTTSSLEEKLKNLKIPTEPLAKARFFLKMGYGASALDLLKKNQKKYAKDFKYWLCRLESAYLSTAYKDAENSIVKALEITTDKTEKYKIYLLQGKIFNNRKKYSSAITILQKAISLQPKALTARLEIFPTLKRYKKVSLFKEILQKALDFHPDSGLLQMAKVDLLFLENNSKSALQLLEQISSQTKYKDFVRARALDRFGINLATSDRKSALQLLKRCRKLFPKYGCTGTEVELSPPDPRHPWRRIRSLKRGNYKK
ncbi:MAG: hypothetical protein PF689_03000 [Deltaproteobacteria bacterium]|jgi:tetratricopeptide (TPR) repeat protein|nr:hypothetical protein [Deltaproteobacteria bacterium]